MWDELQDRSQQSREDKITGTMSLDDVKERTSSGTVEGTGEGGLFDETVTAFTMRRKSAEEVLVNALIDSHAKAFRPYLHKVQWTTVGESAVLGMLIFCICSDLKTDTIR